MFRLLLAVLCAAALLVSPAWATEVRLRVEGAHQTIFEGVVDTAPRVLDGGDGTGPHPCRGDDPDNPRPTPTTALADAAAASGFTWRGNWDPSFNDFFVDAIGPDASQPPTSYWGILANGRYTAGGCTETVQQGDDVLFAYDTFAKPVILQLDGPASAAAGETVTVRVTDWREDADGQRFAPVPGASVGGELTDANGEARLSFDTAGTVRLKAERADAIRSNALSICIACGPGPAPSPVGAPTAPVGGEAVAVRIGKWHDGDRFFAGAAPRILRGRSAAGAEVELTLERRGLRASAVSRFSAGPGPVWSKTLPEPLRPGRYELSASAGGQAAQLRFTVVRGRSLRLAGRAAARHVRRSLPRLLRAAERAERIDTAARLALALPGSGDIRAARALARLRRLIASRQRADGSFAGDAGITARAALALSTGGRPLRAVRTAAVWLLRQRQEDGSLGGPRIGDAGTTGAALAVMARTGAAQRALDRAERWLRAEQLPDGGYGTGGSRRSNASSTALAVIGLRSAGVRPGRLRTEDGISPLDLLRALQRRSGAIAYGSRAEATRPWVSGLAVPALAVGDLLHPLEAVDPQRGAG